MYRNVASLSRGYVTVDCLWVCAPCSIGHEERTGVWVLTCPRWGRFLSIPTFKSEKNALLSCGRELVVQIFRKKGVCSEFLRHERQFSYIRTDD